MPVLNVEHVACNVTDPVAMAAWYVEHLGMRVVRRVQTPPYMHFLADANGHTVIEIYTNPTADPVPDYAAMHPAVSEQVRDAFRTLRETDPTHGRVLTDDFNPVEFYDAKNRENIRRTLALNMKD